MTIKYLSTIAIAAISLGTAFTSCSDEPDKYETAGGTPTISYIRPVDVASKDSLLTGASMGSQIAIVGNNLRSVKQINFNDQKAVLNTSYMTDHSIIVSVPNSLPDAISDKVYFITTGNDTLAYDFRVIIPAPVISSMSNEHAVVGEEVTLVGDYFLDYPNAPLTITVGNNFQIPASSISSITKTAISFTIPEGMPEGEKLTVTSTYGATQSVFQYMDKRGMLFDFDTPNPVTDVVLGNHGWHAQTIQADETSISGNYLLLGGVAMDAGGGWNDGNFSFEYWCGNSDWSGNFDGDGPKLNDVADFSNWEKKAIKFEMLVPGSNPWMAAPLQVIFAGTDKVSITTANNTFFHNEDGWPRALYMPWTSTGSFDTGSKWVTVTIPFTDFNKDWDGNAATGNFSSVEDFASLTLFVVTGGYNDKTVIPTGTDCTPVIKIDNIRVVPNE